MGVEVVDTTIHYLQDRLSYRGPRKVEGSTEANQNERQDFRPGRLLARYNDIPLTCDANVLASHWTAGERLLFVNV